MEPARIRDDVDPNSRKYRRELIIVIAILLSLTIFGGTCLGYKIRTAENQEAAAEQQEQLEQPGEQPAGQRR
jgi:ABC-type uncharacterized transport system permease subunit